MCWLFTARVRPHRDAWTLYRCLRIKQRNPLQLDGQKEFYINVYSGSAQVDRNCKKFKEHVDYLLWFDRYSGVHHQKINRYQQYPPSSNSTLGCTRKRLYKNIVSVCMLHYSNVWRLHMKKGFSGGVFSSETLAFYLCQWYCQCLLSYSHVQPNENDKWRSRTMCVDAEASISRKHSHSLVWYDVFCVHCLCMCVSTTSNTSIDDKRALSENEHRVNRLELSCNVMFT